MVEVEDTDTVEHLKLKLQGLLQMPPREQRLVFSGRMLQPGQILVDLGIQKESTLHIALPCLRGGGGAGNQILLVGATLGPGSEFCLTFSKRTTELLEGGGLAIEAAVVEPVDGVAALRLSGLVSLALAEAFYCDIYSFVSSLGVAEACCHQIQLRHGDWKWLESIFQGILRKLESRFPEFAEVPLALSAFVITEDARGLPVSPEQQLSFEEHQDLYDLTVDLCFSPGQSCGWSAGCQGGGFKARDESGSEVLLPHVPLGGYVWTRELLHSAVPLEAGERIHLVLFANKDS